MRTLITCDQLCQSPLGGGLGQHRNCILSSAPAEEGGAGHQPHSVNRALEQAAGEQTEAEAADADEVEKERV